MVVQLLKQGREGGKEVQNNLNTCHCTWNPPYIGETPDQPWFDFNFASISFSPIRIFIMFINKQSQRFL